MKLDSLEKLYVHELKDLWSANKQVMDVLPQLNNAVADSDLDNRLNGLREQTRSQIERIETVFEGLEYGPQGHKCKGMEGLVTEAKDILNDCDDPDVCNAAVVSAVQRILHYFMAGYGVTRALAEKMGRYDDADMMQESLSMVSSEDTMLSRLAERKLNFRALVAN